MTLEEAIKVVRLRVGETSEGFWLNTDMMLLANQAVRMVAEALHSSDYPWDVASEIKMPVVSGAKYYYLTEDALSIESVAHFSAGIQNQLIQTSNLKSLRLNRQYNPSNSHYCYYQIMGRGRACVARGVATNGSSNLLVDNSINAELANVREGDIIFNENDNDASAVISSVDNISAGRLSVKEWRGGVAQAFTAGDQYRIVQSERTLKQLWVYPIIDFSKPVIFDGSPSDFVVGDAKVVAIELYLSSLPTDPTKDITFVVNDGTTDIIDFGLGNIKEGLNRLDTIPFYFDKGKTYTISASDSVVVDRVVLYGEDPSNYLQIDTVPYPLPLKNDRSIVELEDFMLEPFFRKWKQLLLEKKDPKDPYLIQAQNEYEASIEDAKVLRRRTYESGPEYVNGFVDNRGFSPEIHRNQQGYSSVVGNPEDIF